MPAPSRTRLLALAVGVSVLSVGAFTVASAETPTTLEHVSPTSPTGMYAEGASLVSGRLVNPVGSRTTLGGFPVAMAISPDGQTAVVVNSGQGSGGAMQGDESLMVVDLASNNVLQVVRDRQGTAPTFYNAGITFSPDGKHLYATGGGNDQVYDYAVAGQQLTLTSRWKSSAKAGAPTIPGSANGGIPGTAPLLGDVAAYPRGLAVVPDGAAVIVTNEQGSTVAALSTTDGHLVWETSLGGAAQAAGTYPGSVTVTGTTALVTEQGGNVVVTLDTGTGRLKGIVPVGDHPVAIAATKDGRTAYVANANDDSLSVLDLTGPVPVSADQLSTHLVTGEANGSTPDAVAIDEATGRVYVALAGDNAVAAFDSATSRPGGALRPAGAVPSAAYPTAVAVVDGKLWSVGAKGFGGNPRTDNRQYIANSFPGVLTGVALPSTATLKTYTEAAQANLLYPTRVNATRPSDSPIPDEAHKGQSPIKHVVLVVRENRTFDQVFGDLKVPGADVDPKFLMYGEKNAAGQTVTPNAHAIANRFALSQNFYSDGEASVQGHHWTAEGTSSDYTEKSYVHYYSSRNHPYDPTAAIVYPRCASVFQQLARQGKSFRNFGERVGVSTAQTPTVQAAPGAACATPGGTYDAASAANLSPQFGANLSLTSVDDTTKVAQLIREYTPLEAADTVPSFTYAVLGNDHTDGTSAGKKTPEAHVATNDLAVGQLVEHLSKSPQWSSTAVFVVEDDSQDGLDHRDGHRNVLLVASPYTKAGMLSSQHISQASVLRTMELILGIEPLSSYTQYASVPYDLFQATPDLTPYTAITPTYPMQALNGAAAAGTAASVPLNLSQIDVAGPLLEAQLWEAAHPGVGMPAAMIAALRSRGGITDKALSDWSRGKACSCQPLRPGVRVSGYDD